MTRIGPPPNKSSVPVQYHPYGCQGCTSGLSSDQYEGEQLSLFYPLLTTHSNPLTPQGWGPYYSYFKVKLSHPEMIMLLTMLISIC